MALALYRKYRPAKLADVVGQEHVTEPLATALSAGRINHAYLFSGPRGCGKTSSARILARSLNCVQGPTPDPCGECSSCVALAPEGPGNIDVVELDAASHGGVEDARELRDRAFYAPAESRYRVFVVDEAHMVTTQGFNALLKIVEEPPEHLVFVFATTEPDKVLPTIRSRTHHYPFRLIPPGTMRSLLERICGDEEVTVAPPVFPLVIRAGGGSARDTLSVLDQLLAGAGPGGVTYERAVALLGVTDSGLIDDAVDALAADDGAAVYGAVDRLVEAGHDPRRFAADLLQRFRDLMLIQAVPDAAEQGLVDGAADELSRMAGQAAALGPAALTRYGEILHQGLIEMRGATAPRLLLELLCARMLLPAATTSDGGLLQRLERIERRNAIAPDAAESGGGRTFVRPSERAPAAAGPAGGGGAGRDRSGAGVDGGVPPASDAAVPVGGAEADPAVPVAGGTAPATDGPGAAPAGGGGRPPGGPDGPARAGRASPAGVEPPAAGGAGATPADDGGANPADVGANPADGGAPPAGAEASPAGGAGPTAAGGAGTGAAGADAPSAGGGGASPADGAGASPAAGGVAQAGGASTAGQADTGASPAAGGSAPVGAADGNRADDPGPGTPGDGAAPARQRPAPDGAARGADDGAAAPAPSTPDPGAAPAPSTPDSGAAAPTPSTPDPGAAAPAPSTPDPGAAAPAPSTPDSDAAPARHPEPPRDGAPPDSAPPASAQPAPAVASLDATAVRRVWPEILAAVRQRSRSTEALLVNATVRAVDGDTLVLSIAAPPLARRLSEQRNTDVISDALRSVLGVQWRVRCDAGESGGPQRRAAPERAQRPVPQRPSQRQAQGQPDSAPQGRGGRRPAGPDGDIPLPPEPPPEDAPPDPTESGSARGGSSATRQADDEEAMLAEAAAEAATPGARRDPEAAALGILQEHLGARTVDPK